MRTTLDRFHVGIATEIGPLSLFPVWTEARPARIHRVTPAQGVSVRELEQPTVPQLNVGNDLEVPVLLTEGTLLHGGRQTRVLDHDVLLDANSLTSVSVSCVEQGRWGGGAEHHVAGRVPLSVISALRETGAAQRDDHRRGERQDRVWMNVERYGTRYGRSESASLQHLRDGDAQVRRDDQQARLEVRRLRLLASLRGYASRLLPGQSGILVGALGHPVAIEIISSPAQFAANVMSLLPALALDAAGIPSIPTPGRRARRFAEHAMGASLVANWEDALAVSLGARTDLMTIQSLHARESGALHTLLLSTRHELVLAA